MKQTLVVAVLFVLVLGLALWALGVFAPSPTLPPEAPPDTSPVTSAPVLPPRNADPTSEPAPDVPEITAPIRILVLTDAPRPFLRWIFQVWDDAPKITYQTWSANRPEGAPPENPHSAMLPELAALPKPADLTLVQVLLVDDFDPKLLPEEFWESAAERVKSGALGLWLRPGHLHGLAIAEQSSLKPLLPVSGVKPVKPEGANGQGLPAGVFEAERPFAVTPKGLQHPASRLSIFETWSRRKWDSFAKGEKKWGTKFVYPVAEARTGAAVLLAVEGLRGEALPALVVSDPVVGRVLWTGFFDFGRDAYFDRSRSFNALQSLVLNWVLWLAPPS